MKVLTVGKANQRGDRLTKAIEETSTQPHQEGLAIGEARGSHPKPVRIHPKEVV